MPSALSLEYVRVTISATKLDVGVDPTGDVVSFAFTQSGNPVTWTAGAWETYDTITKTAKARILIGPGSTIGALAVGSWTVWVKVTDSPEIPVIAASTIVIT